MQFSDGSGRVPCLLEKKSYIWLLRVAFISSMDVSDKMAGVTTDDIKVSASFQDLISSLGGNLRRGFSKKGVSVAWVGESKGGIG